MGNKVGIVGFPNVGKSLLFNKLTKTNAAKSANYLFCTIDPNKGRLVYEDEFLTKLSKLSRSKRTVYSDIEIYDIAGLIRGAHSGSGLGNQFLSHIREVNVILHVARGFENHDVIHAEGEVNPMNDYLGIRAELLEADLHHIQKKIERTKSKEDVVQLEEIKNILMNSLMDNKPPLITEYEDLGIDLLSIKPEIVLLNGHHDDMIEFLTMHNIDYVVLDVPSIQQSTINDICDRIYKKLNIICFFTTGEDETRAWTVQEGVDAATASGEIHSDFPKKFVKAKVRGYDESKVRLEGREYIVKNRDVVEFMIGR
jgi:ribosome-binding ATPase YchF (GTP1/OBG family)